MQMIKCASLTIFLGLTLNTSVFASNTDSVSDEPLSLRYASPQSIQTLIMAPETNAKTDGPFGTFINDIDQGLEEILSPAEVKPKGDIEWTPEMRVKLDQIIGMVVQINRSIYDLEIGMAQLIYVNGRGY